MRLPVRSLMDYRSETPKVVDKFKAGGYTPERSLLVASLLTISGGFLDAFTWLLLGRVFANSQTGNIVLFGVNAAIGKWHEAAYHLLPIAGFLMGAWVAT